MRLKLKFPTWFRAVTFVLCAGIVSCLTLEVEVCANEAVALSEMQTLAQAEDFFAIDTNYYAPFEALNDLDFIVIPPGNHDYLFFGSGTHLINTLTGQFRTPPFTSSIPGWVGPYVNYQPGKTQTGLTPYDQGAPLDPWGNPYLLFSPMGLLRGDTGAFTLEYYGNQFDRWTIVSFGIDRMMSSDDLFYQFGGGISSLGIPRITGPDVTMLHYNTGTVFKTGPATLIAIHGYFLGATQGTSKVYFSGVELPNIVAWSDDIVTLTLQPAIAGTGMITVQRGAQTSNPLQLTVEQNAAHDWELYE